MGKRMRSEEGDALKKRLAEQVVRYRTARNMTQGDLAAAIDTKQPAIARLESGTNDIRLGTLVRLSMALGCRPEHLLWGAYESLRENGGLDSWTVVRSRPRRSNDARRFEIGLISEKDVA